MPSRRTALVALSTAAISPMLAQHPGHGMLEGPAGTQPHDPVYFSKADYATLSRLTDLIIPRTDTPGAVDANVPYRIDHEVSITAELQPVFRQGLAALSAEASKAGAADFASLSEAQQTAILTAMSQSADSPEGQFFTAVKNLTIEWYYQSEEGLVTELGFHSNTFRPNFPGCNHPEHWPAATAMTEVQK